jgi:hypothetical protein
MRRAFPAGPVLAAVALAGCGKEGPPVPPEPRGPLPPSAVAVRQMGSAVEVTTAVPAARGPRPDQALSRAELLRVDFDPGLAPPAEAGAFARRGVEVAAADAPFPTDRPLVLRDAALGTLDPLPGRLLRYAVRFRDARNRPSPLAMAPDLVLAAPPGAPPGLTAEPVPEGVALAWTEPPGGAPSGFNVYRAEGDAPLEAAPRNAAPIPGTTWTDAEVVLGTRYRYVVRAVAAEGRPPRESGDSPAAQVVAADRFPPAAPRDVVAVREGEGVRVFWSPSPERDLAGYRVERQAAGAEWEVAADGVVQAQWLDPAPPADAAVAYRVVAFDRAAPPNASAPSEPAEVAPVPEPEPGTEAGP